MEGKPLDLGRGEPGPFIESDRVLVPLRAILEALGATVTWDGETRTVYATNGYHEVIVTIDRTEANRDGRPVTLDVPARIVEGRTFIPLRFTAESLGGKAEWDAETRTALISKEPEPSLAELDSALRNMGFTDDRLSRLHREHKRTIVSRTGGKGVLVDSPDVLMQARTVPTDVVKATDEGDPDSETDVHFELVAIRRNAVNEDDYYAYWVGAFWHWDPLPIIHKRDKIALTWNGVFLVQQSSIYNLYRVQVLPGLFASLRGIEPQWLVQSAQKHAFRQQFNGIAFNVDLTNEYGFWETPIVGQSGFVAFEMTRPKPNSPNNGKQPKEALVVAKYYHRSFCLNMGAEGSISFNPGGASPAGKIDITLKECYSESPARGVNLRWYE